MITEDNVSFETAKLLKEKGFDDEYTNAFYDKTGDLYFIDLLTDLSQHTDNDTDIAASTLYVAMKWLREVHNIVIVVDYDYEFTDTSYCYKIYRLGKNGEPGRVVVKGVSDRDGKEHIVGFRDYERSYKDYRTFEEACADGVKYCLEKFL